MDFIIIINNGSVTAMGTYDELIEKFDDFKNFTNLFELKKSNLRYKYFSFGKNF